MYMYIQCTYTCVNMHTCIVHVCIYMNNIHVHKHTCTCKNTISCREYKTVYTCTCTCISSLSAYQVIFVNNGIPLLLSGLVSHVTMETKNR